MKFENFIKKALRALNESRIKYVVIGGVAATFYGRPRTTVDLDLIVEVKNLEKLFKFLKKNNFQVNEKEVKKALKEKVHVPIFLKNSPYRIDLKGIYSSLDKASISKRNRVKLFGEKMWIERPEDVIIAKLVYGSEMDLEDAKAVILNQKLNLNYLYKRAREEKIIGNLKKLMKKIKE